MYEFFDQMGLQALTEQAVVLRILLSIIFGGTLGLERTRKRRAAGFRTHILVCMSATVVMMTGQFIFENIGNSDPARLGAQVINGISFLGAGTILVTGAHQIKGLTTAASLWSSACLGLALGIGFYFGSFVMWVAMLVVMSIFNKVQKGFESRSKFTRLYIVFQSVQNIHDFIELCKTKSIKVEDFETIRPPTSNGVSVLFSLRFLEKKTHMEVIEAVGGSEGLMSIEEF